MAFILKIVLSPFIGARNALNWAMSARERRRMIAFRVKLARDDNDPL
jgi:hypothetical protein